MLPATAKKQEINFFILSHIAVICNPTGLDMYLHSISENNLSSLGVSDSDV
jgi:hypothetical protein